MLPFIAAGMAIFKGIKKGVKTVKSLKAIKAAAKFAASAKALLAKKQAVQPSPEEYEMTPLSIVEHNGKPIPQNPLAQKLYRQDNKMPDGGYNMGELEGTTVHRKRLQKSAFPAWLLPLALVAASLIILKKLFD